MLRLSRGRSETGTPPIGRGAGKVAGHRKAATQSTVHWYTWDDATTVCGRPLTPDPARHPHLTVNAREVTCRNCRRSITQSHSRSRDVGRRPRIIASIGQRSKRKGPSPRNGLQGSRPYRLRGEVATRR